MSQYAIIATSYWTATFCEGASRIIIPLYFASLGINATKIAILFVIFEFCGLLTNLSAGFFINRFGYRYAFLLSLMLHSVASWGYLGIGYGPLWMTIILINTLRGTRGVAKELIKTTSASYLRHLPKKKHAANILIGGKDSTKGIGLLVGSMLITYLSFKLSFFLLGLITSIMFILSYQHVADFREIQHTSFEGFFNISKRIVILALLRGILYSGRDLWLIIALPIYLKAADVNNAQIGFILASGVIIFGIIQPLTSVFIKSKWTFGRRYLKRKWTYETTVFPSMIAITAIPLLFSILPHHLFVTLLCVMAYNICAGIATTPHNFLHIKFARRNRTAIDISFYKSISLFGKIVALFLSGIIYDQFGIIGCLYAASGSLLIGTIMAYYYYGRSGGN